MGDKTGIQWTDATWNPTVGCSIVSPGCKLCYAMKMAHSLERRFGEGKYSGLTETVNGHAVWNGVVRLGEAALTQPLRWKRPRRVFVNSMSDLFHESLSDAVIDKVFAVMALCPQHTFQVLTKRAERMRDYMSHVEREALWMSAVADLFEVVPRLMDVCHPVIGQREPWLPLPNVWLGVSVEDQDRAYERVPLLLQTPAAVRFLSCEPLLGDLTLSHALYHAYPLVATEPPLAPRPTVDWVIVGGESGPGARPFHTYWADRIVEQCRAASVACFVKQLGSNVWQDGEHRVKKDKKGGDMSEWPHDIRVREFPT